MVLLVADMQELKANPNRDAQGTVIEAEIDKGRGLLLRLFLYRTVHLKSVIL